MSVACERGFGSQWVLQELVPGRVEHSVSLLVLAGRILDSVGTAYECDRDVYIWPHVRGARVSARVVPPEELAVMEQFLVDYSGVCNFNYKLPEGGGMRIFEINTRVGGDLACDAPRSQAARLLEALWQLPAGASGTPAAGPSAAADQPRVAGSWGEPLVIEPKGGGHRVTLVYLHPFRVGLRDYVRKMGLFAAEGLRVVMPDAPKIAMSCYEGRPHKAWYDYLTDRRGEAEDDADEVTLADTRRHLFDILDAELEFLLTAGGGGAVGEAFVCKERLLVGGCSQGCAAAFDAALRYRHRLCAFVGVVGHPLSTTPLEKHRGMPLHFFNGLGDKVMRWHWVGPSLDRLRISGHHVVAHGPFPEVHHGVGRDFEARASRRTVAAVARRSLLPAQRLPALERAAGLGLFFCLGELLLLLLLLHLAVLAALPVYFPSWSGGPGLIRRTELTDVKWRSLGCGLGLRQDDLDVALSFCHTYCT
ncbi:unnamed protein product [Prorocentrum cordatum]|uniref:Phospholipase/carboxylesterase/thioesterase domain-containing protein n=1 Tax=Prorocentrum cordatum TaxID=2364126 RepID=A0ABN9YC64_9DINO|nr:unnamed protein product [Polarella glacialis]